MSEHMKVSKPGRFNIRYSKAGSGMLIPIILIFLLLVPLTAQASWPHMSVEELTQESDLILIGYVKDRAGEERSRTYDEITKWKVQVDYYLKGGATVKELTVATPGTKAKTRSTDYALDEWGRQVMLFLSIVDGYYVPLTPQGIVPLNRSQYTADPKEPLTGGTLLKLFSIGGSKVTEDEREKLESFIESSSPYVPFVSDEDEKEPAAGLARAIILAVLGLALIFLSLGRMRRIKNSRK